MNTRFLALIFVLCFISQTVASEPINVGSDRQLFVDDYLIESLEKAEILVHQP